MIANEQVKLSEQRVQEGIGKVTEFSEEFVRTLIDCIKKNLTDTEFYTRLAAKMRKKDKEIIALKTKLAEQKRTYLKSKKLGDEK